MRLVYLLVLFAAVLAAAAGFSGHSVKARTSYDIYVTVGKGKDGEDGPIQGATVTLVSPDGKTEVKTSDEEGAAKFKVDQKGRYAVKVKASGYDDYEGRAIVDGSEAQVYHLAAMEQSKPTQGTAQIRVRVKDADSDFPIEGASVETTAKTLAYTDRMKTDRDGEAVVRLKLSQSERTTEYTVKVSASNYTQQIQYVKADNRETKVYPLEFSLRRDSNVRLVLISARESDTKAPVMSAHVVLDGGGQHFYSQDTDSSGNALFRVSGNPTLQLKITTKLYDEVTDTIDLNADKSATVKRTYDLERKAGSKDIRRALIVYVKQRDENGALRPLANCTVSGPGLQGSPTDDAGRAVFLHRVPPGETVTVSATKELFKPGSATVLIRDKGVMVDVGKWERRTARGVSDFDALREQGVTAYDTATITLEFAAESTKTVSGEIQSDDEANPGDKVPYSVKLNYTKGDDDTVTIEEVIQVLDASGKIVSRAGNVRTLNLDEPSTEQYGFTPEKAGTYRINCRITWKGVVLWSGEKSVRVAENRRKPTITGNVVPKKGLVKLDEPISVGVNVLYESGPTDELRVSETVELFDPKGAVVQNNFAHRSLKVSAYSERNFNIVCQAPGIYRLKSTIKDDGGEILWSGEGRFEVDKVGKSVMNKPGAGYYRLKNKIVGHAPPPAPGPYGTVSGSIAESSFSCQYEGINGNDIHCSVTLQFSVPPTVVKPNDSFELTVSAQATVEGRDAPAGFGSSGMWGAEGNASVVEGRSVYAGRGSDGKMYSSNSGKFKIAVGKGGSFKVMSGHLGALWGSSDAWAPCVYEYEWVENAAPPTEPNGKTTMTGGSESTRDSTSNTFRGSGVVFGSFGTFSLEIKLGRDFNGSGRSKDGKSIITLYGSVTNGRLDGSGQLNRNGSRYTISVKGQQSGNEIVGEMSVKAGKGTVKCPFRLKRG